MKIINYIPNFITYFRIFFSFAIFLLLEKNYIFISIVIYFFLAISDFFDGFIARKYKVSSFYGSIIDPMADKILVYSVFFYLLKNNIINNYIFYIFIIRDLAIGAFREYKQKFNIHAKSNKYGKFKTILLSIGILFSLISYYFNFNIAYIRLYFYISLFLSWYSFVINFF